MYAFTTFTDSTAWQGRMSDVDCRARPQIALNITIYGHIGLDIREMLRSILVHSHKAFGKRML
jgi:hypothetical protein